MNQPIENFTSTPSTPSESADKPRRQRKALFAALAVSVALAGGGGWAYWDLVGSRYVHTDNAYTAVESAQIMSSVAGTIAEVRAQDAQAVRKGDVLVVIDPTDARLALAQAEAELGRAIRRVKSLESNDAGLGAQVLAREQEVKRLEAQLASAEADFKRAEIDLQRRRMLVGSGSVSGDELTKVENAHASAEANLRAMRAAVAQAHASRDAAVGARGANAAMITGATLDTNPEVALARAKRDQAAVDLERTIIRTPVDGVVARRQAQLGQRVQPSTPLLTVVPVHEMYVNANFKEVQLKDVQPGQKVELVSDLYGSKVVFNGVVDGFNGGTGAAFALIPAQNATGNWIKVVQRLPVRVRLDPAELQAHPLRVGLSMTAKVDLRSKS